MLRILTIAISGIISIGTLAGIVAFGGNITSFFSNSLTLWDRFISNKDGSSKIRVVSRFYTELPTKIEPALSKIPKKENTTTNYTVDWFVQITVQAVNMKGILLDDIALISPGRLKSADDKNFISSTNVNPEKPYTFAIYGRYEYNKYASQMLDSAVRDVGSVNEVLRRGNYDVFLDYSREGYEF